MTKKILSTDEYTIKTEGKFTRWQSTRGKLKKGILLTSKFKKEYEVVTPKKDKDKK